MIHMDMNPSRREHIREFNDIILRMMFFCYGGDRIRMVREALRYDFMWEGWIEPIYGGYDEPPTPEYHRGIVKPPWFSDVDDDV